MIEHKLIIGVVEIVFCVHITELGVWLECDHALDKGQ